MKKQKGFTLIDLLVVLGLCLIGFFVLIPIFFSHTSRPLHRVTCATSLKGLGTAMQVYAHDYNDRFPQLPGTGPWSKEIGFAYDMPKPDFSPEGAQGNTPRTVTASWYLLVRQADVPPKAFICPQSKQNAFDGKNPNNRYIVELWDFGLTPYKHVSYAMHNPYGRFPAHGGLSSSFVVAADMNPWFKEGDIQLQGSNDKPPQMITFSRMLTWRLGNSMNHLEKDRNSSDGQSVLFADGHTSYETQPNISIDNDNIYTFWSTDKDPTEQDKQGGTAPTGRTPENDAKSEEDSFLVL